MGSEGAGTRCVSRALKRRGTPTVRRVCGGLLSGTPMRLSSLAMCAGALAALAACNASPSTTPHTPPAEAPAAASKPAPPWRAALSEASATYLDRFTRIGPAPRWAHLDCDEPPPKPALPGPEASGLAVGPRRPKTPPEHARKVYWLYTSFPAYYDNRKIPIVSMSMPVEVQSIPAGFTVVKEAWRPERLDPKTPPHPESKTRPHSWEPWAETVWVGTERIGLFLMHYTGDANAPGTDAGWVYGVASPDGTKLLESGKLDACINCHKSAGAQRLYTH